MVGEGKEEGCGGLMHATYRGPIQQKEQARSPVSPKSAFREAVGLGIRY